MEAVNKLIAYVIPIVVLVVIVVFLYGEAGAFEKVKGAFNKTKSYLPDVSIGAEKLQAETPTVPEPLRTQIINFRGTVESLKKNPKTNCFQNYGGFSPLEGKAALTLSYIPAGEQLFVRVLGGPGTKQDVTELSFTIDKMKLCVIAGGSYPKRFEQNFLTPGGSKQPIFNEVSTITIAWDTGGIIGSSENRIDHGTGFKDFEAHQWLYKPDGEHVCFFPTVDGGTNEDGLNDDALPQAARGLLEYC